MLSYSQKYNGIGRKPTSSQYENLLMRGNRKKLCNPVGRFWRYYRCVYRRGFGIIEHSVYIWGHSGHCDEYRAL